MSMRLNICEAQPTLLAVHLQAMNDLDPVLHAHASALETPIHGHGHILLVDDEEAIRIMTSQMLETLGYQVSVADNGATGIEVYNQIFEDIDLVIIDMIMPKLSGRDCFRAMKSINPEVKAVLSSGYARDGAVEDTLNEGMVGFIQKPFRLLQFSQTVAEAIR